MFFIHHVNSQNYLLYDSTITTVISYYYYYYYYYSDSSYWSLPASTMAGLLCGHTERTFSTRDVVHNSFS